MRNELEYGCLGCVHIGDWMTVFDECGHPTLAEVVEIDYEGNALLITEDHTEIERVVA